MANKTCCHCSLGAPKEQQGYLQTYRGLSQKLWAPPFGQSVSTLCLTITRSNRTSILAQGLRPLLTERQASSMSGTLLARPRSAKALYWLRCHRGFPRHFKAYSSPFTRCFFPAKVLAQLVGPHTTRSYTVVLDVALKP